MKDKLRVLIALLFGFAELTLPIGSSAQGTAALNHGAKHHHYRLIDLGTLGGPNSSVTFGGYTSKTLNSQGTVVGFADTSTPDPDCIVDCFINHPLQWRNGISTDLGALPGVNNSFASGFNSRGWVVGASQNGAIDPLTGSPEMNAVLWRDGEIINLGTLGGNVSGANALNNRGQVVGGALNTIPDLFPNTFYFLKSYILDYFPFYYFPPSTESHAFLWEDGKMHDLGTLGGPDSVAWFVNERGQVAGQSTIDSIANSTTLIPTVDPFFWDHGKMVDIGNLGGTYGYVIGFNNRGQMAGSMTLAGDQAYHPFLWSGGVLTDLGTFGGNCGVAHALSDTGEVVGWTGDCQGAAFAFLWKNGVMTDLGTVDGDPCSASDGINSKGQVVGESSPSCFGGPAQEGFLWENEGSAVDLNTLISPNSGLVVTTGFSINDRGEINGNGLLPNGDQHAILLIPCDENHPDVEDCDYSLAEATSSAVQLRPAQIPQAQVASPAKLFPGEAMTRFPSLRAGRNRRNGAPQTSPQ